MRRGRQKEGPLTVMGATGQQETHNKQFQKRFGRHVIILVLLLSLLMAWLMVIFMCLQNNSSDRLNENVGKSLRYNSVSLPVSKESNQDSKNHNDDQRNGKEKDILPDPPRKVFVDLGANCGNTYLKRKSQFDKEGGWEIYLWEPSPQMHTFFLNDLADQNPSISVLPYAAGVGHNTTIQLYVHKGQENVTQKKQFRDGGKCEPRSVYNPSDGSTMFRNAKVAEKPVDVPKVNFPEWLERVGSGLRPGVDQFLFKIDIEGAELDIMEELLSPPARSEAPVCVAEVIEMEFHKRIFKDGTDDYIRHEKFEENFMTMFETKCGRRPKLKKLA